MVTEEIPAANSVLEEELSERKKRFLLLEGDRKAYYEASQYTIKQNKARVTALRSENKSLRNQLANISKLESAAAKLKLKGQEQPLGELALSLRNKLCALTHSVNSKESKLRKLQDDANSVQLEMESVKADEEESPHAKQLRMLENRLDKAMIKYGEAQSIRKTYEQIVKRLEKERLGFDTQISLLERAIKDKRKEFQQLESMAHDATHARDVAKDEFVAFEQWLNEERRVREKSLLERRELVAQKIEMNEKMEKRQQRLQVTHQEQTAQQPKASVTDIKVMDSKQEERISNYEEALRKIKDATGVSELSEVVEKFMTQGDTHKHLMELKAESDSRISELLEERKRLREQYEEMKYSGDSKYSGGRRLIDEFEQHLADAKNVHDQAQEKYERIHIIMIDVKAGIEHLADKLEFLSGPKSLVSNVTEKSDLHVVELLNQCEHKLSTLSDGITDVSEEREDLPILKLQAELPKHNVRIKLSKDLDLLSEDEDEDDMDDSVMNRESMKKDSFKLLESKTKKKQRKTKKKRL